MPIYPQMFAQQAQRNVQSLTNYLAQQQQRTQGLQDVLLKAKMEQQIKMQDPLQQMLQRGQLADALSKISALGGDISPYRGIFQGGGAVTPQAGAVSPQMGAIDTTAIDEDTGKRVGMPEMPMVGKTPTPTTSRLRATEFKPTAFGEIRPTKFEDIELKREQQKQEAKLKAKAEVLKLSEKARANFGRSISLFSTMIAQAKGMQEEQKEATGKMGIKTTGLGLLPGAVGGFGVKTRRPWAARTAAFRGQMRETAIGLNSILTGQNRVIRSVVQMIQETLPDPLDPEPMMATKLAQSIMNAYKLVKSFEKAGLDPVKIQQMSEGELNTIDARSLVALYTLSSKEETEIDKIINDVLKTPAMAKRQFGKFQQETAPQPQNGLIDKYMKKYPNRSREEVIRAMQKQGLLK